MRGVSCLLISITSHSKCYLSDVLYLYLKSLIEQTTVAGSNRRPVRKTRSLSNVVLIYHRSGYINSNASISYTRLHRTYFAIRNMSTHPSHTQTRTHTLSAQHSASTRAAYNSIKGNHLETQHTRVHKARLCGLCGVDFCMRIQCVVMVSKHYATRCARAESRNQHVK